MLTTFRPWQREAFKQFFREDFCYLIAPPGEGKSKFGQANALRWAELGKKVLIISPQVLILNSFKEKSTFRWDENGNETEHAQAHTFDYQEPKGFLGTLSTWLTQEFDPEYPYYIATHNAALRALSRLREQYGYLPSKDLAVIIDEAHKMSDSDASKLGQQLKTLLSDNVPTLLMTGTPFRADEQPIVSDDLIGKFSVYNREFYKTLDEAKYLPGFETKVVVGNTLKVLEQILSSFEKENRYAVIKLPAVNSHHARRLAKEQGADNEKNLKELFDREIRKICQRLNLSHISVALDDSEDERLEGLLERARSETSRDALNTYFPRVVVAQEKANQGVDCPWWTDAIMLGASQSSTLTVQFGMRCCRDHESKINHIARFWTLVPEYWEPDVTMADAFDFAKQLVACQLWWYFLGEGVAAPDLKSTTPFATTEAERPHNTEPHTNKATQQSPAARVGQLLQQKCQGIENPQLLPTTTISVHQPDGSFKDIRLGERYDHNGNKIQEFDSPVLPQGMVQEQYNIMDQLNRLAYALIMKGTGHVYHSVLSKTKVDQELILRRFKEGRSLTKITAEVGWSEANVRKVLERAGFLAKEEKRSRPRTRGVKEESEY